MSRVEVGLTDTLKSGASGTPDTGGSLLVEGLYLTFFGALGALCFKIDFGVLTLDGLTGADCVWVGHSNPEAELASLSDPAAAPLVLG